MKKLIFCFLPVVILIVGCSSPYAGKYGFPLKGKDRKIVIQAAAPIADEILNAINSGSYEQFSAHFEKDFSFHMSRAAFHQEREKLQSKVGKYKSHKLRNVFRHGPYKPAVYDAVFEKDTVTVKILLSQHEDVFLVSGLSFDSPKLKKIATSP